MRGPRPAIPRPPRVSVRTLCAWCICPALISTSLLYAAASALPVPLGAALGPRRLDRDASVPKRDNDDVWAGSPGELSSFRAAEAGPPAAVPELASPFAALHRASTADLAPWDLRQTSVWPLPRYAARADSGNRLCFGGRDWFPLLRTGPLHRRRRGMQHAYLRTLRREVDRLRRVTLPSGGDSGSGAAIPLFLVWDASRDASAPLYPLAGSTSNADAAGHEAYRLTLASGADGTPAAAIASPTVFGAAHALRRLATLLADASNGCLPAGAAVVRDRPRFAHRGFLVDTAHHYQSLPRLRWTLDLMALLGFNALHWHLTDDQTFGFRAQSQPELADASAHVAGGAYNASAVAAVVEMAHTRGIAVLPELEMPGHARSWRHSHPEMINDPCPPAEAGCKFANVNPANPRMWTVLANVIADVAAAFPGAPVHFGGDETNFAAWNSPSLQAWAQEQARLGATAPSRTFAKLDTPHQVLEQFETTLQRVVARTLGPRPVVRWEEAMKANLVECCLPPDRTVIQFWRMPQHVLKPGRSLLDAVRGGYRALVASEQFWYLDPLKLFQQPWQRRYEYEPLTVFPLGGQPFPLPDNYTDRVVGAEAACWGHCLQDHRLFRRRTAGFLPLVAERLWSPRERTARADSARDRLGAMLTAMRGPLGVPEAPTLQELDGMDAA